MQGGVAGGATGRHGARAIGVPASDERKRGSADFWVKRGGEMRQAGSAGRCRAISRLMARQARGSSHSSFQVQPLRGKPLPKKTPRTWESWALSTKLYINVYQPLAHRCPCHVITRCDPPNCRNPDLCDERYWYSPRMVALPGVPDATNISLFCFGFSPLRGSDVSLLPLARRELEGCDDHAFFTDLHSPVIDADVVRLQLPATATDRSHAHYLQNQNMVGLAAVWRYILFDHLERGRLRSALSYDWFLNVELDHLLQADLVRQSIGWHMAALSKGGTLSGGVVIAWGNAFVLNRAATRLMARHWSAIGEPDDAEMSRSLGCPKVPISAAQLAAGSQGGCHLFSDAGAKCAYSSRICRGKCEQDAWYPQVTLPTWHSRHVALSPAPIASDSI